MYTHTHTHTHACTHTHTHTHTQHGYFFGKNSFMPKIPESIRSCQSSDTRTARVKGQTVGWPGPVAGWPGPVAGWPGPVAGWPGHCVFGLYSCLWFR